MFLRNVGIYLQFTMRYSSEDQDRRLQPNLIQLSVCELLAEQGFKSR
jgi:hypothetical protein